MQTIIGVFGTRHDAHNAITALERLGYNTHDLSVVRNHTETERATGMKGGQATRDQIPPASAGIVIGGLTGLLLGLVSLPYPQFDALFLRNIALELGISTAIASAVSGALFGGLIGSVLGVLAGRRKEHVSTEDYDEQVSEETVLLAVPATVGEDADRVRSILQEYRAKQIRSITAQQN